jgi:uncharacterized membrane protein YqaE (UPF0057 family)
MRLIIAIFLPWLLQLTLIGWIPATIWAVYALGQYKTDKKIEQALGQKNT